MPPRPEKPDKTVMTPAELVEYSREHLKYECAQLRNAGYLMGRWAEEAQRLEQLDPTTEEFKRARATLNALIESFALHIRNLLEFLTKADPRKTDVSACDFFAPSTDWTPITLAPSLERACTRADKQIAHLTTTRTVTIPDKEWPSAWAEDVLDLMRDFATRAKPHQRLHPALLKTLGLPP